MKYIIQSIATYIILYFIVSFCLWNINWLNNAGNWQVFNRVFLIIAVILKEFINIIIYRLFI